ncbi:Pr6Pr family membrane protein [Sabulilitoribacter multivorans]|uniref:Pr6Pr family membrane protein n=1 Tax=Flaviramulus multivorans TaxID=1304750 RepID=A0ABS9IL05_9FLAO|nr:Pr6Pr family membrane protein [Flaviramulus multivorans]MCF7561287.1 Pr6Pr family membrane protein [Flaviramulus multivorans]
MKVKIEVLGLIMGWFAIITQFILMIENRQTDILETVFRFFSFFTILTNILVVLFFTATALKLSGSIFKIFSAKGTITAITAFILIVGLVYQFVLRKIWTPTGLQFVADELLHSVIPLFMLGYWFFYFKANDLLIKPLIAWLIYPFTYVTLIIIRGYFSGYYPYPFLNIEDLGFTKVLFNVIVIFALIIAILSLLTIFGKYFIKTASANRN